MSASFFLRQMPRNDGVLIIVERNNETIGSFVIEDKADLKVWKESNIPNDLEIPPDA